MWGVDVKSLISLVCLAIIGCTEPTETDEAPFQQEYIPWGSLADTPWPMVRHDAQGTNRSQYAGPSNGVIEYAYTDSVYSKTSVSLDFSNNVYIQVTKDNSGSLNKVSDSGRVSWRADLGTMAESGHTMVHLTGEVGVIPNYRTGYLHWINLNDGSIRNSIELNDGASDVNVDLQGNLIFSEGGHSLVSYTRDGELRWRTESLNARFSYPVVSPDGEFIYVGGFENLYCFNGSGDIVWTVATTGFCRQTMVDNYGSIFFCDGNEKLRSVDGSGNARWEIELDSIGIASVVGSISPTMDAEGNIYYRVFDIDDGKGIASFTNGGEYRWFYPAPYGSAIVSDINSNIYFGGGWNGNSTFTSLSSDGSVNWEIEWGPSNASPDWCPAIGSNERIYFPMYSGSVEGNFVAIK